MVKEKYVAKKFQYRKGLAMSLELILLLGFLAVLILGLITIVKHIYGNQAKTVKSSIEATNNAEQDIINITNNVTSG